MCNPTSKLKDMESAEERIAYLVASFIAFVVLFVVLLVIFLLLDIDPRGMEVGPLPWMAR